MADDATPVQIELQIPPATWARIVEAVVTSIRPEVEKQVQRWLAEHVTEAQARRWVEVQLDAQLGAARPSTLPPGARTRPER